MQAETKKFAELIDGAKQFVIPVFQRDYSWTEPQCEQLWSDLTHIACDSSERLHFLGCIVSLQMADSSAGLAKWLLIDGQQRITTLTVLLCALRDHIQESGWAGANGGPTVNKIERYFLKNAEEEGSRAHKLVLRRHDQATLRALLGAEDTPTDVSERIRDNYDYFRDRLAEVDPGEVWAGIYRLAVVNVTLHPVLDNPQLIFESLNSTGVDLSEADKIRNFVLMRLPEPEQTRLYQTYWQKIENLFRGSERTFDSFARDYLALRTQASRQARAEDIYFAFRRIYAAEASNHSQLEELLADLLRFAQYHAAFSFGAGVTGKLSESLARLRKLVDVPAILVMRLFDCHDRCGSLSHSEFVEALSLLESYVFRRAITGDQTRGYWQVFANLAYRIEAGRPLESMKVGLARLHESYRFPDDDEFRSALDERDIYGKRVCFDLLDRLENYGTKEPIDTSLFSIEHIMPQNEKLSPEWQAMLGPDWRDVQRKWLHRLGNLTLTGYNSTYSDRSFPEKKSIAGGFEDTPIRLSRFVREQSKWTAEEMDIRGRDLACRAISIWPRLAVDRSLLAAAEQNEKRAQASRRDIAKVPMTEKARELLAALREEVRAISSDVIELAERKSVSYHDTEFFLEVLPRKHGVVLLLPLDFNEVDDPAGVSEDASQWKFFVNSAHEGGVCLTISETHDIPAAMPIIRQAHAIAST